MGSKSCILFSSTKKVDDSVESQIIDKCHNFVDEHWNSHGDKVIGEFSLLEGYFFIFFYDDSSAPSGCSKDSLRHFMDKLAQEYNLNFGESGNMYFQDSAKNIKYLNFLDFKKQIKKGDIKPNTIVYNTMIQNEESFSDFKTTLEKSPFKSWIK